MIIIDRFEGDYAVCVKNKEIVEILIKKLPKNAKEGDVLVFNDNTYKINKVQTKARKEKIKKMMESIWD
ncbi:MAG: DUF3006 domain-containing protein [bacterium]